MLTERLRYLLISFGVVMVSPSVFASTVLSFYAKDQHGSIAGSTDASGSLTATMLNQYNDYGVNQSNNNQGQISIANDPYQYSGEYTDNESGLQPLGNGYRYYDPSLMRFISPDSYPLLNLYAYVNGNPIMNMDPTGHIGILGAVLTVVGVLMMAGGEEEGAALLTVEGNEIKTATQIVEDTTQTIVETESREAGAGTEAEEEIQGQKGNDMNTRALRVHQPMPEQPGEPEDIAQGARGSSFKAPETAVAQQTSILEMPSEIIRRIIRYLPDDFREFTSIKQFANYYNYGAASRVLVFVPSRDMIPDFLISESYLRAFTLTLQNDGLFESMGDVISDDAWDRTSYPNDQLSCDLSNLRKLAKASYNASSIEDSENFNNDFVKQVLTILMKRY